MAIFNSHILIAQEAKRLAQRRPEFRRMPPKSKGGGVIRLAAVVESMAVIRRPGSSLFLVSLREYNTWPRHDPSLYQPEAEPLATEGED